VDVKLRDRLTTVKLVVSRALGTLRLLMLDQSISVRGILAFSL